MLPYKKWRQLDISRPQSREEEISSDEEMKHRSRSTRKAQAIQQGFPIIAGLDDSDEALMIPEPPKEAWSQTDAAYLGPPFSRSGGRCGWM